MDRPDAGAPWQPALTWWAHTGRILLSLVVSAIVWASVVVKAHISRLFTKLGVTNRVQIAVCVTTPAWSEGPGTGVPGPIVWPWRTTRSSRPASARSCRTSPA